MAIVKRLVKGSALTHSELDNNFSELELTSGLTFTGEFDLSKGHKSYDPYISGAVVNLSVSATIQEGVVARVEIQGDLLGTVPGTWRIYGDAVSALNTDRNVMLVSSFGGVVELVNSVVAVAPSDTTAPTIQSATVQDAAPSDLVVVFDEVVNITDLTGLSISGGSGYTLTGVSGTGTNTLTFTLNTALLSGESVTFEVAAGNNIEDDAANGLATTSQAITNNVSSGTVTDFTDITNIGTWFDFTDVSTMTVDGSNFISAMNAKGGSGLSLGNQDTTAYQGSWVTDHAQFGANDHLKKIGTTANLITSQFSRLNDWHGFVIFKANSVADTKIWVSTVDANNRFGIAIRSGSITVGYYNGTAFAVKSAAFTDTTSKHKLEFKNVSGVITAYLDGVEMTGSQSCFTSATVGEMYLFDRTDGSHDINLYDFIPYQRELTTQERSDVLSLISTKHGV